MSVSVCVSSLCPRTRSHYVDSLHFFVSVCIVIVSTNYISLWVCVSSLCSSLCQCVHLHCVDTLDLFVSVRIIIVRASFLCVYRHCVCRSSLRLWRWRWLRIWSGIFVSVRVVIVCVYRHCVDTLHLVDCVFIDIVFTNYISLCWHTASLSVCISWLYVYRPHTHTRTHTHTHTQTNTHKHTHTHTHTYTLTYTQTHTHVHTYVHTYVNTYLRIMCM